ncbi:MAG: hypothetical protein RL303_1341 [Verrucomicrobiota bacterium]|jgi:REP element-mobilizing transposase RayT
MHFSPRKKLTHFRPAWAEDSDPIFLTICCQDRHLNQLAETHAWSGLIRSAEEMRDDDLWNPRLIVAMPDHVHLIVDVPRLTGMNRAIRLFKAKSAQAAKIKWQRGAFDHRIRNASAVRSKWHYVIMNPVRANLARTPEEWPYTKTWPRR